MHFSQDLRVAWRRAIKSPLFTITVVVTLALCIGVNTAIYSIIDSIMLRPLGYPEPDRLAQVLMRIKTPAFQGVNESVDGKTWFLMHDRASFLDLALFSDWGTGVNFGTGADTGYVRMQRVSAGFFGVLGVTPMLGREFLAEEDRPNGPAMVILSHDLWRRFCHSAPDIVGRKITLRGEPYTVAGVLPAGFRSSIPADVWMPLRPSTTGEGSGTNYAIIARLRPGVTWEQASAQLETLGPDLAKTLSFRAGQEIRPELAPLQQARAAEYRTPLYLLWAAVVAVLLIGCINIGGLLLARSSSRVSEIATRLALGAERRAIVAQFLLESLVMAAFGGIAGLAVAKLSLQALSRLGKDFLPFLDDIRLDPRVLAAAAFLTIVSSLLFGILPALAAARTDLRAAHIGSTRVTGRHRFLSLGLLATVQVALSIPLLIGAGLLLRTVIHLWSLDPGFDSDRVLTASFSLDDARYVSSADMHRLFERGLERIRQIPGVEAAGVTLSLPYQRPLNMGFRIAGPAELTPKQPITNMAYVSPGYFETLRITLLRGRYLSDSDGPDAEKVAVVNRAFADSYLKEREPLDTVLQVADTSYRVVGVVASTQQRPGWGKAGPLAPMPMIYTPAAQFPGKAVQMIHTWFSPSWVVRSSRDRGSLSAALASATQSVDPLLPLAEFRALDEVKSGALVVQRLLATLVGALSSLALLLTALGIYGLMANSVSERTRELGLRMALGSTVSRALRTALRPGLTWAIAGLAAGLVASLWLARLLQGFLWGVGATDSVTFLSVAATLLAVAALAALLPAWRIATLNPASTLHDE